jgi:hypothetical protein
MIPYCLWFVIVIIVAGSFPGLGFRRSRRRSMGIQQRTPPSNNSRMLLNASPNLIISAFFEQPLSLFLFGLCWCRGGVLTFCAEDFVFEALGALGGRFGP